MRFHLTILSLILLSSCNTNEKKVEKIALNDFSNIQIDFVTGDEMMILHRMSILKDSTRIRAIKEKPYYYYGSKTDSTWITEIGKSELQLINEFISYAESQKDSCSFLSTSIDRYKIKIEDKKQINIIGNCDWNGIDYDSLEKKIFGNKFSELKNKREFVADSIVESFKGIWDVSGWKNGALKNKEVILTRTNENEPKSDGQYRWNFDKIKMAELKNNLDIDEGSSLIKIRGSTYDIISIESNQIELKHLW
ncbi:hypothetical protein CW736_11595 [Nonlabens sp. MB-3u-79]|jgi:hypothetical protein|uniref:hypothetical protein n=1 Tax=Nonlabens sp. MB-3u-79 TaxID=2058134 RepID=UPI000C3125A7|nr:hypothetical protein [Nonlabens sp. MB-3u-79]AUC79967.1 hypothetical protein CW736_11595 [Nonlabens sp. MB-3u-79]